MGRRGGTHNEPPEGDQRRAVEKQVARAEFGRRLSAQLIQKGRTQSEFSRRCEAKAPADMRIGKDSISHYINGRYFPSPSHVKVMAETLGVDVRELMPAKGMPEAGETLPPINIQDMNNGTAWLKINQAVPWPVAVKILGMLRGEEEV